MPSATVGGAVGHGQLQAMVAELDVLLDVVAGAVGGNASFGLASQQFVDGHTQGVAHQVPER